MGLGKTVISLSSIVHRMNKLQVYGTLVVAPVRVIQSVWAQEARKWEHTHHLRFSLIHGDRNRRTRACLMPAEVYLVNYENLRWLADTWTQHFLSRGRYLPINKVIYDEVSKMTNSQAVRHKAMRRLLPFISYRVGLTGTPASNGYGDLFGQYLAVDSGARLGQTKTEYERRFLEAADGGFGKKTLREGAAATIEALIGDITVQMSNADYLELPAVIENEIDLQLPANRVAQYQKMEREMWVQLDSGHEVESFNAAALTNRCLQFAQGAMFLRPGEDPYEELHTVKLDALDEVVEEAAGKPVLIAIEFRHDGWRIQKKFPQFTWIDSRMSGTAFNQALDAWEQGDLPGIIAHPASMGHGVDRLKNGPVDDIVWFGHTWSLGLYEQFIARVQRQGRTRPIRMHHLTVRGTIEEAQRLALEHKARDQNGLKAALNEYRRQQTSGTALAR